MDTNLCRSIPNLHNFIKALVSFVSVPVTKLTYICNLIINSQNANTSFPKIKRSNQSKRFRIASFNGTRDLPYAIGKSRSDFAAGFPWGKFLIDLM